MRPKHWLFTIPLRLRSLFRWTRADQELDDELRDHLERRTEEYVAQGLTQEEAHRRRRRRNRRTRLLVFLPDVSAISFDTRGIFDSGGAVRKRWTQPQRQWPSHLRARRDGFR